MVYLENILELIPSENIFHIKESGLSDKEMRISREMLEKHYNAAKIKVFTINVAFDKYQKRDGVILGVNKLIKKEKTYDKE